MPLLAILLRDGKILYLDKIYRKMSGHAVQIYSMNIPSSNVLNLLEAEFAQMDIRFASVAPVTRYKFHVACNYSCLHCYHWSSLADIKRKVFSTERNEPHDTVVYRGPGHSPRNLWKKNPDLYADTRVYVCGRESSESVDVRT